MNKDKPEASEKRRTRTTAVPRLDNVGMSASTECMTGCDETIQWPRAVLQAIVNSVSIKKIPQKVDPCLACSGLPSEYRPRSPNSARTRRLRNTIRGMRIAHRLEICEWE